MSPERSQLTGSGYVTHMGGHGDFIKKMDRRLENLDSLVFIADGARWIWKWVDRHYPESVQIVDYYHCKEHLCDFAKPYYRDERERSAWVAAQAEVMLQKGIDPVVGAVEKLPERKGAKAERDGLLGYYRRNRERMQYHDYLEKGLLIGSGGDRIGTQGRAPAEDEALRAAVDNRGVPAGGTAKGGL